MSDTDIIIIHPDFGRGTINEMKHDIDGNTLAFIRWTSAPGGIAGGWYDIDEWDASSVTIENVVGFAKMYRALNRGPK